MSWFTLFFESMFPLLIWWKPVRGWLLLCGVLFHIGILVMMNVAPFSVASVVAYPVLMTAGEWESVEQRLRSAWGRWREGADHQVVDSPPKVGSTN